MSRPMPKPGWVSLASPFNPSPEPGLPSAPICGEDPHPPAKVSLLRTTDDALLRAILGGYAHCGRMVDGNLAGKTVHRLYVNWSPGTQYARMHAVRCGSKTSGTLQSASLVSDASAFPANISAASPVFGTEMYHDFGTALVGMEVISTGTSTAAAPDATRAISMTAIPRGRLTLHEVQYVAGFCFEPVGFIADIEDL